jgi:hypothetical protein
VACSRFFSEFACSGSAAPIEQMCPKKHESSSPAGSRRSPRAFRRGMLAGATVREAGARRRRPSATRSAHPFPSGSAAPPTLRTSVSAHQRFSFPPFDPVRKAGVRTDNTSSHRRAHRGRSGLEPTDRSRNSGGGVPASRAGFAAAGRAPTKVSAESPSRHAESSAPIYSAPADVGCQLPHHAYRW